MGYLVAVQAAAEDGVGFTRYRAWRCCEGAEYESRWAVDAAAFGGPVEASRFLIRRKRIFRAAEQAGLTREMLAAFEPSKPGFEARIRDAFAAVARSAGLAAE